MQELWACDNFNLIFSCDGLGSISDLLVIKFQTEAGVTTPLMNHVDDIDLLLRTSWIGSYGDWNYFYKLEDLNIWLIMLIYVAKSIQMAFLTDWLSTFMLCFIRNETK